jgi:hypothetical protein
MNGPPAWANCPVLDMTTSERNVRASLYVRLSREARESNLSFDGMMEDVRALAHRLGVEIRSDGYRARYDALVESLSDLGSTEVDND